MCMIKFYIIAGMLYLVAEIGRCEGTERWAYEGCYTYFPLEVRTKSEQLKYDSFLKAWKTPHFNESDCLQSCSHLGNVYAGISHVWPRWRHWMECWCGAEPPPPAYIHSHCAVTWSCFDKLCVSHNHTLDGVNTTRLFWFTDHVPPAEVTRLNVTVTTVHPSTTRTSPKSNFGFKVGDGANEPPRHEFTDVTWSAVAMETITPEAMPVAERGGLSNVAIVGLVTAVVVPVLLAVTILLLVACFYKRSLRHKNPDPTAKYTNPMYGSGNGGQVSSGSDSCAIYESLPDESVITVNTDCHDGSVRSRATLDAHACAAPLPPLPEKNAAIFTTPASGVVRADVHPGGYYVNGNVGQGGGVYEEIPPPGGKLIAELKAAHATHTARDTDAGYATVGDKMAVYATVAAPGGSVVRQERSQVIEGQRSSPDAIHKEVHLEFPPM